MTSPATPVPGAALVTGGAVRIGRAVALALAGEGHAVAIHYRSSGEEARRTRARAVSSGVDAVTVRADLADEGETRSLVAAAASALGQPISILVNSAGVFLPGGLTTTDPESWELQFAVNLRAPYLLSRAFVEALPASAEGQIVNLLDARLARHGADHLAYRMTKAALASMTGSLALELAPSIRVNAIARAPSCRPPEGATRSCASSPPSTCRSGGPEGPRRSPRRPSTCCRIDS